MVRKLSVQLLATLALSLTGMQASSHSGPAMEAMTDDGRRVLLKEDHTWTFVEVEAGNPDRSALLTLIKVEEMQDACRFQFRLENKLGYKITHLTPRLSVYNKDGIVFDSKSISYAGIKPTKTKYTSVQFNGIGCHEMTWVKVHDAGRCRMGDIDMWNEEEGQCLSHIYVEPSDLINISK